MEQYITATPSQLGVIVEAMILDCQPILIAGPPGGGKTAIVEQTLLKLKADSIYIDAATSDLTVPAGVPWVDLQADEARFVPYGQLKRALTAKKRTGMFFDDIGWASDSVQKAFAHLFHERRTPSGAMLSKYVSIIGATNRRTDKAGVQGLLEPVKSRFHTIIHLQSNLQDWLDWAYTRDDVPVELTTFLQFRGIGSGQIFHQFIPSLDLTNGPSPRTWYNAGRILRLGLPADVELIALCGAVGEGPGKELSAFVRVARDLPTFESIIMSPKSVAIPEKPSTLYALAAMLGARANLRNFDNIAVYLQRLTAGSHAEVAALCLRELDRRKNAAIESPAYAKLLLGPLGRLIRGE